MAWWDEPAVPELPDGRVALERARADPDALRNLGLAFALQWGPSTRRPGPARLRAFVAGLGEAEAAQLYAQGQAVAHLGNAYVEEHGVGAGDHFQPCDQAEVAAAVRADHPWVDDDNLAHLYSQACYYAWHG